MKFFIVLSIVFATAYGFYTAPGEVTADVFDEEIDDNQISRISSGQPIKKGEYLDFCYISVQFNNKYQTCGCSIYDNSNIITTARCVHDCSEDRAWNITVTFPQKKGKDAVQEITKFWVPDGSIASLPAYDPTKEIPSTSFSESNIAVLRLSKPLTFDKKTINLMDGFESSDVADAFSDLEKDFKGAWFTACGIGIIDNKRSKSKGVMCANVTILNPLTESCKSKETGEAFPDIPEDVICLQQTSDANLCSQDYGGPIYAKYPLNGATKTELFGWAIGSPDVRSQAPCLGGHTVFLTYYTDPIYAWFQEVVKLS